MNHASIVSYLLEKSRIVHQQNGERNFHIFYQLVAACAAQNEYRTSIGLQHSCDQYRYMSDIKSSDLQNVDEYASFQNVVNSMNVLGISGVECTNIFQIAACVLRLGNIAFTAGDMDGRALVGDAIELELICENLGISYSEMSRLLVSRNFGVRSIVTCYLSVQQVLYPVVIFLS